jgi:hypothetical protein
MLALAAVGGHRLSMEPTLAASERSQGAASPSGAHPVTIQMQNVRFHASNDVILSVAWLQGALVSKVPGRPPVFDDQRSFRIDITDAEIGVGASSLTALVNTAFDYRGSPLSDLSVTVSEGRIEQQGKLHKVITIPFKVKADVSASTDGRMVLHPVSTSGAGLPIGGLMSALGLELDTLIKSKPERGIQVQQDNLVLDPVKMMPGIEMRGKLTRAAVRGDLLVQTFGKGAASKPSGDVGHNYIWFREGTITFGKLTMVDADLELIDADSRDPFDFYAARYNDQLIAGYSRNTTARGLRTYMPDLSDLSRLPDGRLPAPAIK